MEICDIITKPEWIKLAALKRHCSIKYGVTKLKKIRGTERYEVWKNI